MNAKRGFAPIVLLIIVAVVVIGGGVYYFTQNKVDTNQTQITPDKTANWKTYKSEQHGFELKYPANMEVKDANRGVIADGVNGAFQLYLTDNDTRDHFNVILTYINYSAENAKRLENDYLRNNKDAKKITLSGIDGWQGKPEIAGNDGGATNLIQTIRIIRKYGTLAQEVHIAYGGKATTTEAFNTYYKNKVEAILATIKFIPTSWTKQEITYKDKTIKIADIPAMLVQKDTVFEVGKTGEFKDAMFSSDGTKVAFSVTNNVHDFGWVYDFAKSKFIPLTFQFEGGVDVIDWKNDNEVTLQLKTPKPSTSEVTFNLTSLPEYPKLAQ
jgi:hypothetical protein